MGRQRKSALSGDGSGFEIKCWEAIKCTEEEEGEEEDSYTNNGQAFQVASYGGKVQG